MKIINTETTRIQAILTFIDRSNRGRNLAIAIQASDGRTYYTWLYNQQEFEYKLPSYKIELFGDLTTSAGLCNFIKSDFKPSIEFTDEELDKIANNVLLFVKQHNDMQDRISPQKETNEDLSI